jgi:hypothetical protein
LVQNQIQGHKIPGNSKVDWENDYNKNQQFEKNICNAVIPPPDFPDADNDTHQKDQNEKPNVI